MTDRLNRAKSEQADLALVHDMWHGFVALRSVVLAIHDAVDELSESHGELVSPDLLRRLTECANHVDVEVENQIHNAMNVISTKLPDAPTALQRPDVQRLSLVELVEPMVLAYRSKARKWGIDIRWSSKCDNQMPPMRLELGAMRRAMHNILSNAVKYSYRSSGASNRYIELSAKLHDPVQGRWKFTVENFGIGLDDDEIPAVFRPGIRGRMASSDRRYGAGLGLSEARRCVEQHGGEMSIESRRVGDDPIFLTKVHVILPRRTLV